MGMQEQEALIADLEPLLTGAGLTLVELSVSRHRGSLQVRAVVYAPSGTGTAECSTAHRLILPRVQLLLGVEDPILEVASPGIDRALKSPREWAVFTGRSAKVLLSSGGDWIKGRIVSAEAGSVRLSTADGDKNIAFTDIAKARLDSSQEGD